MILKIDQLPDASVCSTFVSNFLGCCVKAVLAWKTCIIVLTCKSIYEPGIFIILVNSDCDKAVLTSARSLSFGLK